jgi:hypothetical protein
MQNTLEGSAETRSMETHAPIPSHVAGTGLTLCHQETSLVRMATDFLHTQRVLMDKGCVYMETQRQMNRHRMMIIRARNDFGLCRNFLFWNIYVAVRSTLRSKKEKRVA